MRENSPKSDLRVVKTLRVLNAAMFALLDRNCFSKITVRDLCEEALVSRAAFYARFSDKYDFLKNWLRSIKPNDVTAGKTYEETEKSLNGFIGENEAVIRNLICDADSETLVILAEFVLAEFDLSFESDLEKMENAKIVFSHFFTGGILRYFQWQASNKFHTGIKPINIHLYKIIKKLTDTAAQY